MSTIEALAEHSDLLTRDGARAIAAVINAYWSERGHSTVRAEHYELPGFGKSYGVRSNLINGLPPKEIRKVLR